MSMNKKKIAILGGGAGALTAAFDLTCAADWQERYDITVYQMGWRLGGKGASGRNAQHNQRIEEHGLHIWMGFYRNAFRVMKLLYDEIRERGIEPYPYKDVSEAFQQHNHIALQEEVDGEWRTWAQDFPIASGHPWEPDDALPDGRSLLLRLLDFARQLCDRLRELASGVSDDVWTVNCNDVLPVEMQELLPMEFPGENTRVGPGELLGMACTMVGASGFVWCDDEPLGERVLEILVGKTHEILRAIEDIDQLGDTARRMWLQADLALSHLTGILLDDLLKPAKGNSSAGYDDWLINLGRIEQLGYRQWLQKHKAADRTITSAFVRGVEGLVFLHRAEGGAGSALNGVARMFLGYSGSIFYKMKGGMGDVIFSPLYDVLRARGVRFEFFHRVEKLEVSDDKRSVDAIRMNRQVTLKNGGEYDPMVVVKGMRCWPSAPDQAQIVEDVAGHNLEAHDCELSAERSTLRKGRDFDFVVLGIALGAVPHIGQELMVKGRPWACQRWRDLTDKVETTATQAVQLWLQDDIHELGWPLPSTILGAYTRPIDTWADMTHLAEQETWPEQKVGHIAYFCGPLDEATSKLSHRDALATVRTRALDWMRDNFEPILPKLIDPVDGHVRWNLLVAPEGASGEQAFWDAQYWRANIDPSERYVLSVPGSARYRLRADESGYDNLFPAGDWLRTGMNAGCVEAAIMGGLQASKAITGVNAFEVIGDPELRIPTMPSEQNSTRPRYVERLGEQVIGHPFVMRNSQLYGFAIECDRDQLQVVCDQHLNHPRMAVDPASQSQWGYQVLAPYAALMVADMPHMVSTHPAHFDKGVIDEIDVALWVPVIKWEMVRGIRIPRQPLWFLPYVFVNRAVSMAGGREIMGYFKTFAHMDLSAGDGDLQRLDLSAYAIPRFGVDARARPTTIMTIENTRERSSSSVWDFFEDLARNLERKLSDTISRTTAPLIQGLMGRHVPMVFLKQFRDSASPDEACYQAIIEGATSMSSLHAAHLLEEDEYKLTLHQVDSVPLPEILGVAPGPQKIRAAWSVRADIAMEIGRTVWRAD